MTLETQDNTNLLHEDDEGRVMPLLCHQASVSCHHMEATRGFTGTHLGLGRVLLPQPVRAVVGHNPPVPEEY